MRFAVMNDNEPQQIHPERSEPPPQDPFTEAKAHAQRAAETFRTAAEAKARELRERAHTRANELRENATVRAGELMGDAERAYGEARGRAQTMQEEGTVFVRENPLKALGVAILTGFFLGTFFRGK